MDGSAPLRQTSWDWRAASNFTFGGAGSGLAFIAALLALAGGEHVIAGFLLAVVLVGAGFALVWDKTGQPKQFLQVFFKPQTSWKSREALIAPALLVATLVAAVLPFSPLLLLVLLLAAGLLFAQGRILGDAISIPAWRERSVVPLILTTGGAEGAALLTVAATLTFSSDGARAAVSLAVLLAALRWPVWTIYRDGLSIGAPPQGAEALRAFGERRVTVVLWVPVALLAVAAVLPVFGWVVAIAGGLASAAAGWWLKYLIINQTTSNQGYGTAELPPPAANG
jgi:hypothetical protein